MNNLVKASLTSSLLLMSTVACSDKGTTTQPQNTATQTNLGTSQTASDDGAACSTLSGNITSHCTITANNAEVKKLTYSLNAKIMPVTIPVEGGASTITVNDALVYNETLAPARLELRRGDQLNINFQNLMPSVDCSDTVTSHCIPQRLSGIGQDAGMSPVSTNLHTHGLITAWDFKDKPELSGDNVLGVMTTPAKPVSADSSSSTSTSSTTTAQPDHNHMAGMANMGNSVNYLYPILPDHPLGLDWYHPHPHGVTGLQVEGGMSGLLLIADPTAEKYLNPVYLQLKDMQTRKLSNDVYQFEKFEPSVAVACHSQGSYVNDKTGDTWLFDTNSKGRCNYKRIPKGGDPQKPEEYAWLFLVNGKLFPTLNVAERPYFRVANTSANATYRLMLVPETVSQQTAATAVYFTPPLHVIEKDGMTTLEQGSEQKENLCTLTMTTATRVGFGVDFEGIDKSNIVCKLTVDITTANNKKTTQYKIEPVLTAYLTNEQKADIQKSNQIMSYTLLQEGINTGEDDWPAIQLAKLVKNSKLSSSNLTAYQQAVNTAKVATNQSALAVREPAGECPSVPALDEDQVNRHVVLYYGKDKAGAEHFGLVASGEKNGDKTVDRALIKQWRNEYLAQLGTTDLASNPTGTLLEYDPVNLGATPLAGLKEHKFTDGNTNICTKLGTEPERWRIHNLSTQIHNFHLHQSKFKVLSVRGSACTCKNPNPAKELKAFGVVDAVGYLPADIQTNALSNALDEQCVKTYAEVFHDVPAQFSQIESTTLTTPLLRPTPPIFTAKTLSQDWGSHDTFPVPPMGYIDIEVNFNRPENVGEYVLHCHILEHEDAGMMGKIVVKSK